MSDKLPVNVTFLTSEVRYDRGDAEYYLFVVIKKYARRRWKIYLVAHVENCGKNYHEIIRTQALEESNSTPEFLNLENFMEEHDLENKLEMKITPGKHENYEALKGKIEKVIREKIL